MAETPPTNSDSTGRSSGPAVATHSGTGDRARQENASPATFNEEERPLLEGVREALGEVAKWGAANPVPAVLLATVLGTLIYFFGYFHPFYSGTRSTLVWARSAWNPEGDQSYGAFVPLIALGFIVYHWGELRRAPKQGVNAGLGLVLLGIILFVIATRCLQPRIALASVPVFLYGMALYLWGRAVARIVLFPCAFLIFMVPVGALTQGTFQLQFLVTGVVGFLSRIIGVGVEAIGTTLKATDNSFDFEIAEGCSGIRSLMAMVMITAAYVHLTQNRFWKKLVIFGSSMIFAVIGNIGRVFSIILVARFYDKKFAAETYHDSSGWLFFPIALAAMLACDRLVNLDWAKYLKVIQEAADTPEEEEGEAEEEVAPHVEATTASAVIEPTPKPVHPVPADPYSADPVKPDHEDTTIRRYEY